MPIDARGLDRACARLHSRTARVIGWGSGSVFDYFHGLYPIRLEYRNQGAPAALSVQFGTGPAAKQPVPTPNLYPADGLSSFTPVEQSYRRLSRNRYRYRSAGGKFETDLEVDGDGFPTRYPGFWERVE